MKKKYLKRKVLQITHLSPSSYSFSFIFFSKTRDRQDAEEERMVRTECQFSGLVRGSGSRPAPTPLFTPNKREVASTYLYSSPEVTHF